MSGLAAAIYVHNGGYSDLSWRQSYAVSVTAVSWWAGVLLMRCCLPPQFHVSGELLWS